MQMIDVLKRLAELDAKNPNIKKTDEAVKFGNYTSGVGTDRPADQAGRNALAKDLKFNRDFHRQHIKDPTNPYRKGAASGAVNDVTPVNDPRTTHPSQIEGQGSNIDPRRVDHVADEIIAAKDADRPYYFGPDEDTPEFRAAVADLLRDMGFETSADEIDTQQDVDESSDDSESLTDFFSNLRNDVERGLNVVDTFHDKVDQLPDELPAEVVQFLRDQSAEADGAQDDPEEMKSIMLAAIDKVESELGLHNNMKRPMSESLDECGMMGSMSQPHTPASVNVTADNGMELTNMLKDIMSLAGLRKVGPDDLGHEREPSVMTGEPGVSVAKLDSNPMDMKSIISKIDSMNDEPADEEIGGALAGGALGGAAGLVAGGIPGAIGGALSGAAAGDSLTDPDADEVNKEAWNNTPRNPTKVPHMSKDAMTNKEVHNQDQSGHPGVGDRMDGDRPKAFADVTYESLMKEYQKFINEN